MELWFLFFIGVWIWSALVMEPDCPLTCLVVSLFYIPLLLVMVILDFVSFEKSLSAGSAIIRVIDKMMKYESHFYDQPAVHFSRDSFTLENEL